MRRLQSHAAGMLLAVCVAAGLTAVPACRQLQTQDPPSASEPAEPQKPWWQRILPSPQKFDEMFYDERSRQIERNLDRSAADMTIRG